MLCVTFWMIDWTALARIIDYMDIVPADNLYLTIICSESSVIYRVNSNFLTNIGLELVLDTLQNVEQISNRVEMIGQVIEHILKRVF